MCIIQLSEDAYLTPQQESAILEYAMAVQPYTQEGTYYRYDGTRPGQRVFCKTLMRLNKLYSKDDINQMSFRGDNSYTKKNGKTGYFGIKGSKYSIFKWRGSVNCMHYWREIEIIEDEDGLPREYDRGIVDGTRNNPPPRPPRITR